MDYEKLVYDTLCADPMLVFLLSETSLENCIYNLASDNAAIFPRVTFSNYLETGDDYADDIAQGTHLYFQVDIINQGADVEEIADEVENALLAIDFYHVSSHKIVTENDKTKIIEKHIQFVIYIEEV